MTLFEQILNAPEEDLLKLIYRAASARDRNSTERRSREIARRLGIVHGQMICAIGFHEHIRDLPDIVSMLGFPSYEELAQQCDRYFTQDVYERLGIKSVLAIYSKARSTRWLEEHLQPLLQPRLQRIEDRIETSVNPLVIERYKKEIRAIYGGGLAWPEFVESRLKQVHTGFRALLCEVQLIVENRIIPVGDLFFRDDILPEEKRRLIKHGLVPRDLVESRLQSPHLPLAERHVLEQHIRLL